MSEVCEQLKQLKLTSGRLFPRGHALLNGLTPTRHKHAFKFADEHPEVNRILTQPKSQTPFFPQLVARLERKFPRHPRHIKWDKVCLF